MKPLHTSSQVTASDSRMVVRVVEISTPDGPVRRIVVEVNAEMDTTEARWLRDKLDLAITLAEGEDQSSTTVARGQAWLHCTGDPTRTLTVERVDKPLVAGVDNMTFVALRTVSGQPLRMLVSWLRAYYRPADLPVPAVSEDQPKPRVWRDETGSLWCDADPEPLIVLIECDGSPTTNPTRVTRSGVERAWGPLVEVLADAEQVTR